MSPSPLLPSALLSVENWQPYGDPVTRRRRPMKHLALPLYQIEGRWVRGVDLAPGRYAYRFVVDGNEQTDPMNANEGKDEAADIGHSVVEIEE